ncbi:MAG: hypothetical protein OXI18_11600 [bacterium]|nr:hypothetical protein [bacterium]
MASDWQQVSRFAHAFPTALAGWQQLTADPSRQREATVTAAALIGQLAAVQTFLADWIGDPEPDVK